VGDYSFKAKYGQYHIIRLAITAYSCIKNKMSLKNLAFCPNQNMCAVTLPDNPEALPCGQFVNQLDPLLLAEDVCVEVLRGALDIENTRMRNTDLSQTDAKEDLQVGSLYVDLAMHKSTSQAEAEAFFAYGKQFLTSARDKMNVEKRKVRLIAGLLVADLPLFLARKYKEKVSESTLDAVQLDIAKLHKIIEAEHTSNLGWLANLGLKQFLLRDDFVPYAATTRESRDNSQRLERRHRRNGHVGYLIEGGKKIPMNASYEKKKRQAGETPVKIPVGQIIEVTVAAMAPELRKLYPTSQELARVVIGWAAEEPVKDLGKEKIAILDMVSDTIVRQIQRRFPILESEGE